MDLNINIEKPPKSEYPDWAQKYINQLPDDGLILQHMRDNYSELKELIADLPNEKFLYRYEEGKWTIKEILQHIIDGERVFQYRSLAIARDPNVQLAEFDQDIYAAAVKPNERDFKKLLKEFKHVRKSSLSLYKSMNSDDFMKSVIVGNSNVSVRSYAYMIVGHTKHHLEIIRKYYI